MAYPATTWVEGQTTVGPTNLNKLETAASKMPYGPDFSSDNVPVWSGSAWVAQKIVNAQVDNAAAIAYSKLSLSGSILAADISTGTGIPLGRKGHATTTTSQTGITTVTDATGLSVTWTAVAGRYYRLMASVPATAVTNTAAPTMLITDSSNTQIAAGFGPTLAVGDNITLNAVAVVSPGSGSVTYKVRVQRQSGTGTITIQQAGNAGWFVVEDIGV